MIKHIIKLMWNRKRRNFLLMIEITISFLVLFAIGSIIIYNYNNFFQESGFKYNNVWILTLDWKDTPTVEAKETCKLIRPQLLSYPEIEKVALVSSNHPFSFSTSTTEVNNVSADFSECGDDFFDILKIPVIHGRVFNDEDRILADPPIVISELLAETLFPGENPVGKVTEDGNQIVGVIGKFRYQSSFDTDHAHLFRRVSLADTGRRYLPNNFLIRVAPGTDRRFEVKMMNKVYKISKGWDTQLTWMEDAKTSKDKLTWVPVLVLVVISAFLIINVSLGLFGLLWYNINQRKSELGLRRAMGARIGLIKKQLVSEVLVIATFAILLGLIIAIQFPLLGVFNIEAYIFVLALVFSALFIYGLTALCAYFAGRQASRIQPAVALHEE